MVDGQKNSASITLPFVSGAVCNPHSAARLDEVSGIDGTCRTAQNNINGDIKRRHDEANLPRARNG